MSPAMSHLPITANRWLSSLYSPLNTPLLAFFFRCTSTHSAGQSKPPAPDDSRTAPSPPRARGALLDSCLSSRSFLALPRVPSSLPGPVCTLLYIFAPSMFFSTRHPTQSVSKSFPFTLFCSPSVPTLAPFSLVAEEAVVVTFFHPKQMISPLDAHHQWGSATRSIANPSSFLS